MQHIYLQIKTASPVAIRSDHARGGAATASYIPGTTLIGSLAAAHRMLRPRQEQEFARLFLEERIFFPPLYPAVFNQSNMGIERANLPVRPLPKTAQSCKRFSGFQLLKGEIAESEKRHGIRDSLLDWAVFSLLDDEKQAIPELLSPLAEHEFCTYDGCHQPLDHIDGYYRRAERDPKQRMKAKSSTRLQTRTGINREWGIVEENILYNRQVFDEGTLFWGEVLLSDEKQTEQDKSKLSDVFTRFVEEASKEDLIRIGTGRTRGLGNIEEIKKPMPVLRENLAKFKEKLDEFNTEVQLQAKNAGVKTRANFYFAITLHSATILCDPFMRYHKALDTATLRQALDEVTPGELLNAPSGTFKKIYQATSTQCITGWNELWGTPRPNDYAIEMGSTFLFSYSHTLDDRLLQALYMLEESGIGRRRPEGFGRLCVSDPFHLEGELL